MRVRDLQRFDLEVAACSVAVQVDLKARCQVNCYLTPPRAKGFSAHFDTTDVLVVGSGSVSNLGALPHGGEVCSHP